MNRNALPIAEWPLIDRLAWTSAIQSADWMCFLDDDAWQGSSKARPIIRPNTISSYQRTYGQYLNFIKNHDPELLLASPGSRATDSVISAYIDYLKLGVKTNTVAIYLSRIYACLIRIDPTGDLKRLAEIVRYWIGQSEYLPTPQFVTAEELYKLGDNLMNAGEAIIERSVLGSYTQQEVKNLQNRARFLYRDGLMIASTSLIPLRKSNTAALELSNNTESGHTNSQYSKFSPTAEIIISKNLITIEIDRELVKNNYRVRFSVPKCLDARYRYYVDKVRPLFGDETQRGFWLSCRNRPLSANSLWSIFVKRTIEGVGEHVNPHRFRHAAMTFLSDFAPDAIFIGPHLLRNSPVNYLWHSKYVTPAETAKAAKSLGDFVARYRR